MRFTHAETEDDDRMAVARLRTALGEAGFVDVAFEYEPVAAAHHYERRLDHDELVEPEKIQALIHVVEHDLGHHLYASVERTKVELSRATCSRFLFDDEPLRVEASIARTSFDEWIDDELRRIGDCVDRLLEKTDVSNGAVDRVFMTGGSSLVPAVQRVFAKRFGEEKLRAGDELTSVALGLALRAREMERV